jgi:hypothetical protein
MRNVSSAGVTAGAALYRNLVTKMLLYSGFLLRSVSPAAGAAGKNGPRIGRWRPNWLRLVGSREYLVIQNPVPPVEGALLSSRPAPLPARPAGVLCRGAPRFAT